MEIRKTYGDSFATQRTNVRAPAELHNDSVYRSWRIEMKSQQTLRHTLEESTLVWFAIKWLCILTSATISIAVLRALWRFMGLHGWLLTHVVR